MQHFIYVFSEEDKVKLLSEGYTLLRENPTSHAFVFITDEAGTERIKVFESLDNYFLTDVLTF